MCACISKELALWLPKRYLWNLVISPHLEQFNEKGRNFKCNGKNRSKKTKENSNQKSSFLTNWANSAALEKALSPLWSWLICLSSHLNRVTHLAYLLLLFIEGKWEEVMPSNSDLGSRERRMTFFSLFSILFYIKNSNKYVFKKQGHTTLFYNLLCFNNDDSFLGIILSRCIVFYYVDIVQFI